MATPISPEAMAQADKLLNLDEIRKAVGKIVDLEKSEFDHPEPEDGRETSRLFSSKEVIKALNSNEDGDAWLYIELHRDRFVFDHAAGCWFVWAGHCWKEDVLGEAMQAIQAVVEVYGKEFLRQSWLVLKAAKSNNGN